MYVLHVFRELVDEMGRRDGAPCGPLSFGFRASCLEGRFVLAIRACAAWILLCCAPVTDGFLAVAHLELGLVQQ